MDRKKLEHAGNWFWNKSAVYGSAGMGLQKSKGEGRMSRIYYPPSMYRTRKRSRSDPYYSCADCKREFYKQRDLWEHIQHCTAKEQSK